MANPPNDTFEGQEILVSFQPKDDEAAKLLRDAFTDTEILESNAFTGAKSLMLVVNATKGVLKSVLSFFSAHRERFKDTQVRIGKDEFSLSGFSAEEVQELLASDDLDRIIDKIRG